MSATDRLAGAITTYSKLVIVLLLVTSAVIGAGAMSVEQTSSLAAFQSDDSRAAQAQDALNRNFSTGDANTTSVQVVVRDDNVLDGESLRDQLAFQAALRDNQTVNATLANTTPTTGMATALATARIFEQRARALQERGVALEARGENLSARREALKARGENLSARAEAIAQRRAELDASAVRIAGALNSTRAIQSNYSRLNRSFARGNRTFEDYSATAAALDRRRGAARERAATNLTAGQAANVTTLLDNAWRLQGRLAALNRSLAAGQLTEAEYRDRTAAIQSNFTDIYRATDTLLAAEYRTLRERDNELAQERARYDEQIDRLHAALGEIRALQRQYDALNTSFTDNTGADTYQSRAEDIRSELQATRDAAVANLTENQTQRFDAKVDRMRSLQREYDGLNASLFGGSVSQSAYDNRSAALEEDIYLVINTVFASEYDDLRERENEVDRRLEALNTTGVLLETQVNRTRALQRRYDAHNRSLAAGAIDESTYAANATAIREGFAAARTEAVANLSDNATARYDTLLNRTREFQHRLDRLDARASIEALNDSTYRERTARLREQLRGLYDAVPGVLAPGYARLQDRGEAVAANRSALTENRSALEDAFSTFEARRANLTANRSALENRTPLPRLSEQRAALDAMNESTIDARIGRVLDANTSDGTGTRSFAFVPRDYEPGSTEANATAIVITQATQGETGPGVASDRITQAQITIREIAEAQFGGETRDGETRNGTGAASGETGEASGDRVAVLGNGLVADEINRSITDSLLIVGPLALVFVLLVLLLAYRDLLDVVLGLVGIGLVLLWTLGFMGWAEISFNQIFVVIPVLLIGLSIDYAIHVVMRHREERSRTPGVARSMRLALASVGVALVMVTATAVIGFLSNLVSSVPPIREFGIVSAVGITAALVIFGALVPALKVEFDGFLEARGWGRNKRAVGTGGSRLGRVLSGGAVAARKAPWAVLAVALVLTAAGGAAATQVDTSFSQEEFIADQPPEWTEDLPEPFAPGEYAVKHALETVSDRFVRPDGRTAVLVRGNVTTPGALDRVARGVENASAADTTRDLPTGGADVESPLAAFERVATENETFNATLAAADTDGDRVPDRNVPEVYDALYAADPGVAESVIHRTEGGEYESLRVSIGTTGEDTDAAADARAIAATIEDGDGSTIEDGDGSTIEDGDGSTIEGGGVTAVATGQPVVFDAIQNNLLRTVIESLLLTLAVTFAFLMVVYRLRHGSATLGFLTLLPVAFGVAWILGTMYLLSIPFNVVTGLITSLTVGLGIAYSIHLSERYSHELARQASPWAALRTAVTGTGGALLGSAATTVGGFGVLAFAILPPLRQFGIITALTIAYAFLASVLVLPSLLALWTRYVGPESGVGRSAGQESTTRTTGDRSATIED